MPAKDKRKWYQRGKVRETDAPLPTTAVKAARKEAAMAAAKKGALTMDEKLGILEMYQSETDTNIIAQKFNRTPDAIRKFIWRYASTTKLARARLEGGSEKLANRIIEQANVDQSLEVMDRLDILAKKREKAAPASSFHLIIGVPPSSGKPSVTGTVPIPDQRMIDDAIEAEAKVVEAADGKG